MLYTKEVITHWYHEDQFPLNYVFSNTRNTFMNIDKYLLQDNAT
jgi:hypothetical protein